MVSDSIVANWKKDAIALNIRVGPSWNVSSQIIEQVGGSLFGDASIASSVHRLRTPLGSRVWKASIHGINSNTARDLPFSLVMRRLGLKAFKPGLPGPTKPGPAWPDRGLGGLGGPAFSYGRPGPALKPGPEGATGRSRSGWICGCQQLYSTSATNGNLGSILTDAHYT